MVPRHNKGEFPKMSKYIWIKVPATDESEDDTYEMRYNDYSDTHIHVQDGRSYGAGYSVNHISPEHDRLMFVAEELSTLKEAKRRAEAYFDALPSHCKVLA